MFGKLETEVLVVGAGPVGLFAALSLAERGVQVEIVDEEWRTAARSYALALHPRSLELLDRLGLAEELVARGHRVHTSAFYEGQQRRGELRLGELPRKFPFLLVLPQDLFEDALRRRLAEKKVKVQWSHRVAGLEPAGDRTAVRIERLGKESTGYGFAVTEWMVEKTSHTQAAFVIGADGHRSAVRRALGIDYPSLGEPDLFAVFEFATEAEVGDEVRVVLTGGTTSVLWPVGPGCLRWSLQLVDKGQFVEPRGKGRLSVQVGRGAFPYLGERDLEELLAERAPWFDAPIGEMTWSVAVRFERRLAEAFGRDNVWLAGDAAHLTGPVGVQSMNSGLGEVHDLAERIAQILRTKASPALLATHGRERLREWRGLLALGGGGLAATEQAGDWVRDHAADILPTIPACGEDLDNLASQIGLVLGKPA